MCDICGDNRFEIIDRAKEALIESTNIETSPKEMEVLDDFLFRCWQMGWLDKYDTVPLNKVEIKNWHIDEPTDDWKPRIIGNVEVVVRCKDCEYKDKPTCPEVDNIWFTDNDFCSWAKMKGGNDV